MVRRARYSLYLSHPLVMYGERFAFEMMSQHGLHLSMQIRARPSHRSHYACWCRFVFIDRAAQCCPRGADFLMLALCNN